MTKAHCPLNFDLFRANFRLYTPAWTRLIRETLQESREDFGNRFFVSADAVKKWETGKRELPGPALRLMLAVEDEALRCRNLQVIALRKVGLEYESERQKEIARFGGL